MRRAGIVVCAAALLVVAGCSGDDGDDGGDAVQPTVPATTSSGTDTTEAAPTDAPTSSTEQSTTTPGSTAAPGSTTVVATTTTTTTVPLVPLDELELALEVVADGFEQPLFLTSPPGDGRRFVVDQPGRIWLLPADGGDPEVFLDIRDRVTFGGEQGLLGLAFPPDYAETGLFYVDYTAQDGATHISEFAGGDPAGERVLLEIPQPARNHNGGMVTFGPDGMLWIGMGDGGGADDGFGNGQDPTTLLGTLLRIDPTGDPYATPSDNPGPPFAPEIWAIGLRNPWRFSFDGETLWVGDVGQNSIEEIDHIDLATGAGSNFGWPLYEGPDCYLAEQCDDTGLVIPVYDYSHDEGCSVTGGYVYHGTAIPELDGHYFFGDYCAGWVRTLAPDGNEAEWFSAGTVSGLSSFGVDADGELYVTSTSGTVFRIVRG